MQLLRVFSRSLNSLRRSEKVFTRNYGSLYEPSYLALMKPPHPTYDVINVKISGFDFPILEIYQRFIHRMAESIELDVSECWAQPPKKTKIIRYKENSNNVDAEYNITTYERFLQISDLQAPIYPVFLRFIQTALPEGVKLSIVHHTDFIEESRYVPDKELLDLKVQLEKAGGPLKSRK